MLRRGATPAEPFEETRTVRHRRRTPGGATEVWAPQVAPLNPFLLLWVQQPPASPCSPAACSETVCPAPMLRSVPRTLRVLGLQSAAWSRAADCSPQSGRRLGGESLAASLRGRSPARESGHQLDWLYQMSSSWSQTRTRRGDRAASNRRSLWAQPSRSTAWQPFRSTVRLPCTTPVQRAGPDGRSQQVITADAFRKLGFFFLRL